jgi:oligosaccharide reducing-end xylanase
MSKQASIGNRRGFVLGGLAGLALVGCGGGGDSGTDLMEGVDVGNPDGVQQRQASTTAAAKLNDYWNALFVQGALCWTNTAGDEALIHDGNTVKSEGQSYGMMISVMMNDQNRFRALWKWTKNHMRHTSPSYSGRLAWLCNAGWSGWQGIQNQSAPDGEIWMATALHLAADKGWGAELRGDANYMCDVLMNANPSPGSNLLPFFNRSTNLVNFVPESWSNYTDPSYATPAFFTYLATKHNGGNSYWNTLAYYHRELMKKSVAINGQGLAAEFTDFNGNPVGSHLHSYDAWRVTMNQTLDRMWNGETSHIPKMKSALSYMTNGLSGTLNTVCDAYAPSYFGGSYTDTGQVAMYATGAKGGAPLEAQPFGDRLLDSPVNTSYYSGLLATLSLLILNGKFVK